MTGLLNSSPLKITPTLDEALREIIERKKKQFCNPSKKLKTCLYQAMDDLVQAPLPQNKKDNHTHAKDESWPDNNAETFIKNLLLKQQILDQGPSDIFLPQESWQQLIPSKEMTELTVLVFINNHFHPEHSKNLDRIHHQIIDYYNDCYYIEDKDLNLEYDKNDFFDTLNLVMLKQAMQIQIPAAAAPSAKEEQNILILHLYTSMAEGFYFAPRINIQANAHSKSSIMEAHIYKGPQEVNFSINTVTKIKAHENADITHAMIQNSSQYADIICGLQADLSQSSSLKSFCAQLKGQTSRYNLHYHLNGKNCQTSATGIYYVKDQEKTDFFSQIYHHCEHSNATQLYKGILSGKSKGIFTGGIQVDQHAQKVNSQQLNQNLLLDKKSQVYTRPWLQIYADDVKCGHGATIGQIGEEEKFYLQSRGIQEARAQTLLCRGFFQDTMKNLESEFVNRVAYDLINNLFQD